MKQLVDFSPSISHPKTCGVDKLVQHRRQTGFTLIEIVVVMVILAILGGVVLPQILDRVGDAQKNRVYSDFANIATALDLYKLDNYRYPTTEQGLEALVNKPETDPVPKNYKSNGYLDKLPKDPWDQPYYYSWPPEHHKKFDIFTLGSDGIEGGEDAGADIGNWQEDE